MKHTAAESILSCELLRFLRDALPTVEAFSVRAGDPHGQALHVLRKAGAVVVEGGRVRLSRRHLSPDGSRFVWGIRDFQVDSDEIRIVVRAPGSEAPTFGSEA